MIPIASRTLLILFVIVAAGCGVRQGSQPAREGSARVEVRNQAWSQMTIYAVSGGQRIRLGQVAATQTAILPIPRNVVAGGREVSFVADALAGGESRSFSIYVRPGDTVTLSIPNTAR